MESVTYLQVGIKLNVSDVYNTHMFYASTRSKCIVEFKVFRRGNNATFS